MSDNDEAPTTFSAELVGGDELELLTVEQVAELFHVPVKWVYAKAASGELPSIKIGWYRRFRRDDLRRFLQTPATPVDTAEAELVRRPRRG